MAEKILPNLYKQYNVYYWVGRVDGKVKWIRLSSDYQEALIKYLEHQGSPSKTGTVGASIKRYRAEVLPGLAPKTQKERGYHLNVLEKAFGKMQLSSVKPPHIQQYLYQRDAKVAANREIKLLSTIYRHSINWGLCESNPCQGAFYHKEKPRDQEITDQQFILLQEKSDPTLRAMIQIAFLTGMRRGDLLDLRWSEIEEGGIRLKQNKTRKKQFFNFTPDLLSAINLAKTARKTRNMVFVFTNNKGQQITETGFNSSWRRLRTKCNLENLHFHDIRGKALVVAKQKRGIDYAQDLGGHDNRSQTEAYIGSKSTLIVDPIQ